MAPACAEASWREDTLAREGRRREVHRLPGSLRDLGAGETQSRAVNAEPTTSVFHNGTDAYHHFWRNLNFARWNLVLGISLQGPVKGSRGAVPFMATDKVDARMRPRLHHARRHDVRCRNPRRAEDGQPMDRGRVGQPRRSPPIHLRFHSKSRAGGATKQHGASCARLRRRAAPSGGGRAPRESSRSSTTTRAIPTGDGASLL
jgi:hypothetical protein